MNSSVPWGETATIAMINVLGGLLTLVLTGWIAMQARKIHSAVNSTATAMAQALKAEQDKNSVLAATNATLVARAEGKQIVQDLKDAAQ